MFCLPCKMLAHVGQKVIIQLRLLDASFSTGLPSHASHAETGLNSKFQLELPEQGSRRQMLKLKISMRIISALHVAVILWSLPSALTKGFVCSSWRRGWLLMVQPAFQAGSQGVHLEFSLQGRQGCRGKYLDQLMKGIWSRVDFQAFQMMMQNLCKTWYNPNQNWWLPSQPAGASVWLKWERWASPPSRNVKAV